MSYVQPRQPPLDGRVASAVCCDGLRCSRASIRLAPVNAGCTGAHQPGGSAPRIGGLGRLFNPLQDRFQLAGIGDELADGAAEGALDVGRHLR